MSCIMIVKAGTINYLKTFPEPRQCLKMTSRFKKGGGSDNVTTLYSNAAQPHPCMPWVPHMNSKITKFMDTAFVAPQTK